jgi:BirA family biotin operon repressor/biotin-[acetyl-CoA-carboxylase] ligase
LDSTNRWLLDEARQGAPEGVVAVADHQTAGRGRLGRNWDSPAGASLLCSVLLRPDLPLDRLHLAVAAVALAGRAAARDVAGVEAGIKWPNDLLVGDGRKLAGVLAEADLPAVVVGIGMNVTWAPPGGACLVASAGAGAGVSRDALLDSLLDRLGRLVGEGDWAAVASAYRAACVTLGQAVRVELTDETFTGVAADVSDEGHLLVDVGMCLRTVAAGDVIHLR